MKKKLSLFLVAVFCLSMAACSKDAEVAAFITEFDAATKEIVDKIDANPSAAGVDEAAKAFEARKPGLKAKFDAFKNAREAQITAETKKNLNDSMTKNMSALTGIMGKHMMKFATDKVAMEKFKKLMEDYGNTFKME